MSYGRFIYRLGCKIFILERRVRFPYRLLCQKVSKCMKKIKILASKVGVWWMLRFRNTLVREVEFDAYKVTFRRFTMDITTKSGNMKLRTMMMFYPNSFLYHALEQDDEKMVHWFCDEVYQFVSLITTDQGLANDVHRTFAKYYKRMEKKTESLAKEVSENNDDLAIEELKFNEEYAKKSKKERKEYQEALREELRNGGKDE